MSKVGREELSLKEQTETIDGSHCQTNYPLRLPTDGRFCFYGVCYYCTGPEYGACAEEDGYMEGALLLHLPPRAQLVKHAHPWRRTYNDDVKAE